MNDLSKTLYLAFKDDDINRSDPLKKIYLHFAGSEHSDWLKILEQPIGVLKY